MGMTQPQSETLPVQCGKEHLRNLLASSPDSVAYLKV